MWPMTITTNCKACRRYMTEDTFVQIEVHFQKVKKIVRVNEPTKINTGSQSNNRLVMYVWEIKTCYRR